MTAPTFTLQEVKGALGPVIASLFKIQFENPRDGKMMFIKDHFVETGSDRRADDFYSNVAEISAGTMYDTSSSTAVDDSKDFNQITNKENIQRLGYKAAQWFIKRDDMGQMNKVMSLYDPTNPTNFNNALTETYGSLIEKMLIKAVTRSRYAVLDAYLENIASKTVFGEKIVKASGDLAAGQVFGFTNVITTALSDAAIGDIDNAFEYQTDETGTRIGDQTMKYLWVNNDRAAAKVLANPGLYANVNYRSVTGREVEVLKWSQTTPDNKYVALSDIHALRLVSRSYVPKFTIEMTPAGLYVIVDEHTIATCDASCGIVYGNAS